MRPSLSSLNKKFTGTACRIAGSTNSAIRAAEITAEGAIKAAQISADATLHAAEKTANATTAAGNRNMVGPLLAAVGIVILSNLWDQVKTLTGINEIRKEDIDQLKDSNIQATADSVGKEAEIQCLKNQRGVLNGMKHMFLGPPDCGKEYERAYNQAKTDLEKENVIKKL